MGYKLLGFLVWQVIKLYLRRRMSGAWPKVAAAGAGVVALAGVVGAIAAGRSQSEE